MLLMKSSNACWTATHSLAHSSAEHVLDCNTRRLKRFLHCLLSIGEINANAAQALSNRSNITPHSLTSCAIASISCCKNSALSANLWVCCLQCANKLSASELRVDSVVVCT